MKPVVEIAEWGGSLLPGFTFEALSIPAGQSYSSHKRDCDVASVIVPSNNGHVWLWVRAGTDQDLVAWAAVGAGASTVQCCDVFVDEGSRKNRIATALYQLAACLFAAPVVPTEMRSPLSEMFWKGRSAITC